MITMILLHFILIYTNLWINLSSSDQTKYYIRPIQPIANNDTSLVDLQQLDPTLVLDIKYATTDNFTKQRLYPCAKAYLRKPAALALIKAHKLLKAKGYRIKIFDAYRPLAVQWRLWNMYQNPDYVADPRKGSMHNRGLAIDLTLVDKHGKELDMGTPFDYFGERAHSDYRKLPQQVLANRYLLKSVLKKVGFQGISTEWWHFSYRSGNFGLLDVPFECGGKH